MGPRAVAALLALGAPLPALGVMSRAPCVLKQATPDADGNGGGYYFACDVFRGEDPTPVTVATFKRPFKIGASPLRLQDVSASFGEQKNTHFHYYVSVLGDMSPTDRIITESGKDDTHSWPQDSARCSTAPCAKEDKGCTDPKTAFAGAFQWDDRANVTNPCKRLTGTAAQGADLTANTYYGYSAYLIDEEDAAKGIMLHRGGGTDCGGEGERKLNITLECGT